MSGIQEPENFDNLNAQELAEYHKRKNPNKRYAYGLANGFQVLGFYEEIYQKFCLIASRQDGKWTPHKNYLFIDDKPAPIDGEWTEVFNPE